MEEKAKNMPNSQNPATQSVIRSKSNKSKNRMEYYRKKKVKLLFVALGLTLLTIGIFLFVYDVGISSATYETITYDRVKDLGDVFNYFMKRENSIYIYYLMLIVLIGFNYLVFKRIAYLWKCYTERNEIEKVLSLPKQSRIPGFSKLVNESIGQKMTICKHFIIAVCRSFQVEKNKQYFNQFYDLYFNQEEEQIRIFDEGINRCIVWIIRLGIFGTLIGIAVAFYQIYLAMGGLDTSGGLTEVFIEKVRASLLGNTIAVATSIAAHGATLAVEFGISLFLRGENNIQWFNKTYDNLLRFEGFATEPATVKENIGELNVIMSQAAGSFENLAKTMDKINPVAEKLLTIFNGLEDKTQLFNKNMSVSEIILGKTNVQMKDLSDHLSDMSPMTKNAGRQISELSNISGTINKHLKEIYPLLSGSNKEIGEWNNNVHTSISLFNSLNERSADMNKVLKNVNKDLNNTEKELADFNSALNKTNPMAKEISRNFNKISESSKTTGQILEKMNPALSDTGNQFESLALKSECLNQNTENLTSGVGELSRQINILDKQTNMLSQFLNNSMKTVKGSTKLLVGALHDNFTAIANVFKKNK